MADCKEENLQEQISFFEVIVLKFSNVANIKGIVK